MDVFGKLLSPNERPTFSGDIKKYFLWKEDYWRLVHPIAGDDVYVLKCCLMGKPKELVDLYVSWGKVWDRLDEIYGCKRRFVLAHLHEILHFSEPLDVEKNMINFINKITFAWDQLCYFDCKSEMNNLSTLIDIERLLPFDLMREWVRHSKSLDIVNCENLVEFLSAHRWCLEHNMYLSPEISVIRNEDVIGHSVKPETTFECKQEVEMIKRIILKHQNEVAGVVDNLCDAIEVINSKVDNASSQIIDHGNKKNEFLDTHKNECNAEGATLYERELSEVKDGECNRHTERQDQIIETTLEESLDLMKDDLFSEIGVIHNFIDVNEAKVNGSVNPIDKINGNYMNQGMVNVCIEEGKNSEWLCGNKFSNDISIENLFDCDRSDSSSLYCGYWYKILAYEIICNLLYTFVLFKSFFVAPYLLTLLYFSHEKMMILGQTLIQSLNKMRTFTSRLWKEKKIFLIIFVLVFVYFSRASEIDVSNSNLDFHGSTPWTHLWDKDCYHSSLIKSSNPRMCFWNVVLRLFDIISCKSEPPIASHYNGSAVMHEHIQLGNHYFELDLSR